MGMVASRSRVFSHLSVSLLGLLFVFGVMQFEMDGLRGILVDGLFRLPWLSSDHSDTVIITYDDLASKRYGYGARFPVTEMEGVLNSIRAYGPEAILVVGTFNERLYSEHELDTLNQQFSRFPNTIVGFNDDESLGKSRPTAFSGGFSFAPAFVSRDTFSFGGDSVSRRVMLTIDGQPTAYMLLARQACEKRQIPVCDASHFGAEYLGNSAHTFIHWRNVRSHEFSSEGIIRGEFTPEDIRGKVVVVGTKLSARKGADHILTPLSRDGFGTPMLEGVAKSVSTLIQNDAVRRSPVLWNWICAILVGLVTVNLVLAASPGRGILLVVGSILVMNVAGWLLLRLGNIWIDLAHPMVIACVGYYLVIPYRLVEEYRKRWHYQEKSELMIQLEQLKSNFLSLVSHDLKTPIARIQGNAELVLEGAETLKEGQRKSLQTIVKTTENLSQYVESILDLTRVENAKVPLNMATRDINSTLFEVIEEKAPLALEKGIEVRSELDPIFSMRYDEKLMRRVFGNLLENAIQYSSAKSCIVVRSQENSGWVRVSLKDQGVGIAHEDHSRVFQKFFRCNNDATVGVKGTGLGLFLVKYFVELHRGIIDLESELGKGSTFTVSLPIA